MCKINISSLIAILSSFDKFREIFLSLFFSLFSCISDLERQCCFSRFAGTLLCQSSMFCDGSRFVIQQPRRGSWLSWRGSRASRKEARSSCRLVLPPLPLLQRYPLCRSISDNSICFSLFPLPFSFRNFPLYRVDFCIGLFKSNIEI